MKDSGPFEPSIHIRTAGNPLELGPMVRREVAALDPQMAVYGIETLEEQLDESITGERMSAAVSSGFSLLALVLAAVGLYGVIAFTVARRTREIGIRMALGAAGRKVAGVVLRTVPMVGAGIALGWRCRRQAAICWRAWCSKLWVRRRGRAPPVNPHPPCPI